MIHCFIVLGVMVYCLILMIKINIQKQFYKSLIKSLCHRVLTYEGYYKKIKDIDNKIIELIKEE